MYLYANSTTNGTAVVPPSAPSFARDTVEILYVLKYSKLIMFVMLYLPLSLIDVVDSSLGATIRMALIPILYSDTKLFILFE